MKKYSYKVGHLTIHSLEKNSNQKNALILGNAYGIMPYVKPLAKSLHNNNINTFWFAFSGQENTSGNYSYSECSNDIKIVVDFIYSLSQNKTPIYLISHCAGSLMTLEYLLQNKDHPIKKLIIYGLLFNANRRRLIAERKLMTCNVNYNLNDLDWKRKPLKALSNVDVPVLFCHSKDSINLQRATVEEMKLATTFTKKAEIEWFDEGYDENLKNIDTFVNKYLNFIDRSKIKKPEYFE